MFEPLSIVPHPELENGASRPGLELWIPCGKRCAIY